MGKKIKSSKIFGGWLEVMGLAIIVGTIMKYGFFTMEFSFFMLVGAGILLIGSCLKYLIE